MHSALPYEHTCSRYALHSTVFEWYSSC